MAQDLDLAINAEEDIKQLAACVLEEIREDYLNIEDTYHWPERKYRNKKFLKFPCGAPVGFENTYRFRMKTPLLWKLICEKESIEITEEEYLKYEPKHKDSKSQQKHEADPVLINKKWFIEIAVREFGGINAGDFEDLAGKINEFYNKLEHSTSLSKDKFDCLGHRIASWSKVLTFIDPSKFVIYDSRVAFRLNSIINLRGLLKIRSHKNRMDSIG